MRGLKVVLWVMGVACLMGVLGLVLPEDALQSMARRLAGADWPASRSFLYLVRALGATYFAIGIFFLLLAADPVRHATLVRFVGSASMFVGAVCLVTGWRVGLPALWYLGDGLTGLIGGLLIALLSRPLSTCRINVVCGEEAHKAPAEEAGPEE